LKEKDNIYWDETSQRFKSVDPNDAWSALDAADANVLTDQGIQLSNTIARYRAPENADELENYI